MQNYLNEIEDPVRVSSNHEALVYWKSRKEIYPKLASSARHYFVNAAGSAPVERIFSHKGVVMGPHGAKTTNASLIMILFLEM